MRKTILLSSVLAVSAAMLCLARPIRGNSAASEVSYSLDPSPMNTDYLMTADGRQQASQLTHVSVGTGTDFLVGARLVVDVTIKEWIQDYATVFACFAGHGYEWCRLSASENLLPGRYTIEWVNQATTAAYHLRINNGYSLVGYSTWWQLQDTSKPLYIGSRYGQAGWTFTGLYHSICLYDSAGVLRHRWIPDPSGNFYDEIDDVFATRVGNWTYGDLANE